MKIGEAIMALKMMNLTGAHPFLHWEEMMEVRDMAISALREQEERRWIPVTERLPDENGKYIVNACYDIWDSTIVMVAEYYSGSRTWYDECCECSLEGIVTHWMPLPEPPEEVSK